MDEKFFFRAMKAAGIRIYVIDETTTFEEKPMSDINILRKSHYRAAKEYLCDWSDPEHPHQIAKGRRYVRIVFEDANGKFQADRVCLDCWVKP